MVSQDTINLHKEIFKHILSGDFEIPTHIKKKIILALSDDKEFIASIVRSEERQLRKILPE